MAFLDDSGVTDLTTEIKARTDATYVPLSDMTVETFTGTAQSNISGNCQGIYVPALGLVFLTFNFTASSSAASTSTNLFLIPSAYRPSENKFGAGYGKSSSATGGVRALVNSSGYVRQYTMSACTGGNGFIVYEVAR